MIKRLFDMPTGPVEPEPHPWVNDKPIFRHCGAGLFIGPMHPEPKVGEFGAVLTLAAGVRTVEDGIRHRHIPLGYQMLDDKALDECISWVHAQFLADRTTLVRSEAGKQRPGLVIAGVFLRLGATYGEATSCVWRANSLALNDFRYLRALRDLAAQ